MAFHADLVEVRGLGSIQRLAGWNAAERPPPGDTQWPRAVAGTRGLHTRASAGILLTRSGHCRFVTDGDTRPFRDVRYPPDAQGV